MSKRSDPESVHAWRMVITVEYPQAWDFWDPKWGTPTRGTEPYTEMSYHGPYLSRGPAKVALKRKLRELENHYRYETAYRKRLIAPAKVTARLEQTTLMWELLEVEKSHHDSQSS